MIGKLNHIAIAVPDLSAASKQYSDVLGAKVSEPLDQPEHGVTVIFVELENTKMIGQILYTKYFYLFQICGIILLVAMIGSITLTFRRRENIKRQRYFDQIQRDKESGVSLIDVESGKGVKLDD